MRPELPFIFKNLPLNPAIDGARPLLQSYWVNFVKTGDPNGDALPAWPRYGADRAYVAFTQLGAETRHALRSHICGLLDLTDLATAGAAQ